MVEPVLHQLLVALVRRMAAGVVVEFIQQVELLLAVVLEVEGLAQLVLHLPLQEQQTPAGVAVVLAQAELAELADLV